MNVGKESEKLEFKKTTAELKEGVISMAAMLNKHGGGRDKWDSELSGKMISHVDEKIVKQYVEKANDVERIDFTFTSVKDTLDRLYVTNGDALTNAACAVFVGMPLLEVQMAVFATKQKLTFLDIRRGNGNIRQLVEIAVKYIIDNIRWRVVFDGSLQRKEVPEVPIEAVREAVTNSFCHRDYRSSQNNEVAIYSNRIEIYNPGRFPDGQTPEDFIEGRTRSIRRNPNIAQLLYYSKDIESFGTGLQRLVDYCHKADVRVEFERSDLGFTVIFYRPVNHINTADSITENITENITDSITDSITENITDSITVNETQKAIILQMQKNSKITAKMLSEILGIADRNVKNHIKILKEVGLISREGSAKSGYWVVKG